MIKNGYLLFGFGLEQGGFIYNFDSEFFIILKVDDFMANCESSLCNKKVYFSEPASFGVPVDYGSGGGALFLNQVENIVFGKLDAIHS